MHKPFHATCQHAEVTLGLTVLPRKCRALCCGSRDAGALDAKFAKFERNSGDCVRLAAWDEELPRDPLKLAPGFIDMMGRKCLAVPAQCGLPYCCGADAKIKKLLKRR